MQMYKAMHEIVTLSTQRMEEKEAVENQAFELGMKYKCLEKHCARQKDIHEKIRKANESILKEAELKQFLAAEANARAEAAGNRVTELQRENTELQMENAKLQK